MRPLPHPVLRRPERLPKVMGSEEGMIVLAPLIVITVTIIVLVVAGKLMYPPPPRYDLPNPPVRYVAGNSAPIYRESRVVGHVEAGEKVWAARVGDGAVVLFPDSTGSVAIGISPVTLRPVDGVGVR